ncbi:MAG TPA: hypothetical protein VFV08_14175 [Puia sp.]|nr:hypothetical protein [Puia sp.]
MKPNARILISMLAILVFTGCATILSRSNWPFSVRTNPEGATVIIKNKKGQEIFNGRTPANLKLRSGAGFFAKESYAIAISLDGYESKTVNLECRINGWYFGNILIGGLIGMLVVDPATGAMYRLDSEEVYENLETKPTSFNVTAPSLMIAEKDKIPADWTKHLVPLQ